MPNKKLRGLLDRQCTRDLLKISLFSRKELLASEIWVNFSISLPHIWIHIYANTKRNIYIKNQHVASIYLIYIFNFNLQISKTFFKKSTTKIFLFTLKFSQFNSESEFGFILYLLKSLTTLLLYAKQILMSCDCLN